MCDVETAVRKSIKTRWTGQCLVCSLEPYEEIYFFYCGEEEDGSHEEFKEDCINRFVQKLKESQAWSYIEDAMFQMAQGWI